MQQGNDENPKKKSNFLPSAGKTKIFWCDFFWPIAKATFAA
jgi:hypothetical protein